MRRAYPARVPGILVVDDDPTLREVLQAYLAADGLDTHEASDGPGALRIADQVQPDLVLLDLSLPGLDGLEVFRRLRLRHAGMPVLMVTARGGEAERILGLEIGADDYITKPCSPREVVLRVRSVLRRAESHSAGPTTAGGHLVQDDNLIIDRRARTATLSGAALELTTREFDLLAHFVAHPGVAFTRTELMRQVWGWEFGDETTVTVHVRRLREKVETDSARPTRIVTVWGVGYRWDAAP